MKKAPKRFRKGYADGGEAVDGDPKKALDKKLTPAEWDKLNAENGNTVYPYSSGKPTGHKTYYDAKMWEVTKDETDPIKVYSKYLGTDKRDPNSLPMVDLYDYDYKAPVKTKPTATPMIYGNYENGKQVPYQGKPIQSKAKGGTVKKMTKAPCRMKKGGTC